MKTTVISTELDSQHRDWVMPEEWEELVSFLDEHDQGLSPFGPFDQQVKDAVDNVDAASDPDYRVNLVLPVAEQSDLDLWVFTRETNNDD